MLNNLLVVSNQVLTLFLMMAVGFVLRKIKKLSDETLTQLTFLLLYVAAPCIIINSLQIERNVTALREMGMTAAAAFGYFAIGITISMFFFKRKAPDTRTVLRVGSAYTNNGFMGLPLINACLGKEAMLYAVVFLVVFALVQWTHGIIVMSGKKDLRSILKKAVLNPGMVGFAIGFIFFITGMQFPSPVAITLEHMSSLNSPIAMVVIGAQIADADIMKLFRQTELYLACFIKQVALPAIMMFGLLPFNLPPLVYSACVILAGTPSAAVTAMFARQFGRDAQTAARLVSLSTLLSIITLPLTAALTQWLATL